MKKEIYLPISNRLLALVLFISILGGWFYWFQYRPTQIVKTCNSIVEGRYGEVMISALGTEHLDTVLTLKKEAYKSCLRERGIRN